MEVAVWGVEPRYLYGHDDGHFILLDFVVLGFSYSWFHSVCCFNLCVLIEQIQVLARSNELCLTILWLIVYMLIKS